MAKIWYISLHFLFYAIWYFSSEITGQLGKNQVIWKLTSLEWVSAYISFTYFFFALLGSIKSSIVRPKLRVSLYLLTVSLLTTSLFVTVVLALLKQEEPEEFVLDFKVMFVNGMLKGGLLVLAMIELNNFKEFDCPSWTVLVLFDLYLTGWYCFVQYMCRKATGSFSYELLNAAKNEELALVGIVLTGINVMVKYLVIAIKPKPVIRNNKVNKSE